MKKGKTREELEEKLVNPVLLLKRKRKVPNEIKDNLLNSNNILEGNTQNLLNNPKEELSKVEWRVLLLFAEQIYQFTKDSSINVTDYFTDIEIKKAKQYTGKMFVEEDLSLPMTLDNVLKIGEDKYVTIIPASTLAEMSSFLLNYNFNIQREAQKKVVGGETIQEATLIMDNVIEIKEHLIKGTLETTTVVINVGLGTSDAGEDVYYDQDSQSLVINKGAVIDIVDGYHRCKASELAVNEKDDIKFNFILQILNYTDDQAMKYQGQLAKQTPIKKSRQKQLAESRLADTVMKKLNTQSELAGRFSMNKRPNIKNKELVTYKLLADTIEEEFDLERKVDAHLVGDYLSQFFDILLGYYEDEFLINPRKYKKTSLINENNMFMGYTILAKRMYNQNIEASEIVNYIQNIDFSIDNQEWKEYGVLNETGNLNETKALKEGIRKYFNNLKLKK